MYNTPKRAYNGGILGRTNLSTTSNASGCWSMYEAYSAQKSVKWPDKLAPDAPTIGTATALTYATANITFVAPTRYGNSTITGYTATSSPAGITASNTISPITISGLSQLTSYAFTVIATNAIGNSLSSAASNIITTPARPLNPPTLEYLVVAGGGGGGGIIGNIVGSGGGGAGGYRTGTANITNGASYTVTVGQGGTGGTSSDGTNGANSIFDVISTTGGGWGSYYAPSAGGSGGGGGGAFNGAAGGAGNAGGYSPVEGYNGGNGIGDQRTYYNGGGGGGAGGVGANATTGAAGTGGIGRSSSITGVSVTYGVGGNGAPTFGGTSPAAAANTGNGGNGGASGGGSNGGSGIVILAYLSNYGDITTTGNLVYDQPVTRSGYKVYRFTSGTGTISW